MTSSRLPAGGRIDRERPIAFHFNSRRYEGFAGDSLASALLANDVAVVGRSFKRHRPRGLLSLGMEEPNAILDVTMGGMPAPNRIASELPLRPDMAASPTRGWPSLKFDVARALDFWPAPAAAGFYYKTFMGPGLLRRPDAWNRWWEPLLRRMAGQGTAPEGVDPDRYEHVNAHVDIAVVGAGVAGLAAATAAAAAGARVAVFERDIAPGGRALSAAIPCQIDGMDAADWAAERWRALAERPDHIARLNTTAFGLYDGRFLAGFETLDGGGRIWHVRAERILLAPGALERPMTFPGNDRPGVMLAGAVESAVTRYGVQPGRRVVLYQNYAGTAGVEAALAAAGAAIVDRVGPNETVVGTSGGAGRLAGVDIAPLDEDGRPNLTVKRRVAADLLATSGGWSPALALHLIQGGRQQWDAAAGCFVAAGGGQAGVSLIGAADARFTAAQAIASAHMAAGGTAEQAPKVEGGGSGPVGQGSPLAPMADGKAKRSAFVDFQHDVTVSDLELAAREGFVAIEHAKRFTTSGMGTDQGRTAQVATAAALARATGRDIGEVGLSGLRPPVTPTPFGALGGGRTGVLFHQVRKTPMHRRHVAAGAVFEDVGDWKRARFYPKPGEAMRAAVARECLAVRQGAGALDVSTLGKIDVSGPDAAAFLNRIYTNRMDNLKVGACRYGLMLKDDGMVFDDGVAARLSETRFHITTTSGGAANVLDWLEDWRQTELPDLNVRLASVTEQWAGVAIAGPKAREIVARVLPGVDVSNESLPHLRWRDVEAFGGPARLFRVSFSGELGYEINVPWRLGERLWDAVIAAGAAPYGTEAMHVLRAEKGFIVVGHDTDGTVTPVDLGMNWIVSKKKGDFIGKRALARPALIADGRKQMVGLEPEDPKVVLDEGAQLIATGAPSPPEPMLGHVTSSYWSAALDRGFAMALLADGRARHGERLFAWSLGAVHAVKVRDTAFYDPTGERMNG